ncbi:ferredoxin--NADP reductase [Pseudonocardia acaciae]|uniref:ferredoxin--NADP reductase n=1 Tax=Pseudonocardia acaciae TaxID=551276 RepID=UPI00048AE8C1|nr:ferredoxin--NADP reductase [Pseudonocardia acaciae]
MADFHRLAVAEVVQETADAVSLVLRVPSELAERYAYRPGQFLTVRVPGPDGTSLARCYSLSSSPHDGGDLMVTVKRVAEGRGSNWICDHLSPGMELDALPPEGTFTPRTLDADLLLVAAGSGITPVMSIIRAVLARGRGHLVLLYANRDERSVIFAEELRGLAEAHPDRLVVAHWLESVQGLPTRAHLAGLAGPFTGPDGREVFLCGPTPFMDAATHALRDLGVPRKRLHIERFVSLTEDPFESAGPQPDTAGPDSTVEVELDGQRHRFRWPAGTKLLDLLRERGLDAPFSCREGACSACACRVVGGEVKMLRNEVLDQTDLDEGYVLACQSLPVTEEVTVSYDE